MAQGFFKRFIQIIAFLSFFLCNTSFALHKNLFDSSGYSIDFYSTKPKEIQSYNAVMKVSLKKGLKMFAKNQGDDILTPQVSLKNAKNILDFVVNWPIPEFDSEKDIYMFERDVFIPVSVTPKQDSLPSSLDLEMDIVTCDDMCTKDTHLFSIGLPVQDDDQISSNVIDNYSVSNNSNLPYILLLSLLGGFILNFMPCVLPVISLKVLSVVKAKHSYNRRMHFAASSLGVISCFLVLGFIISSFKSTGQHLGLGFNFQHPVFVITITLLVLFFAFAVNDVLNIDIPESWKGWFVRHSQGNQLFSSFASGAFATILATPCTAPVLGVAMSMALALSSVEILLSFLCMGIGLSLPFIVFMLFPNSTNIIPAPGKWTVKFKKILAIFLYLTAIWLIWIIYSQLGFYPALSLFLSCLLLKFFLSKHAKLSYSLKILLILSAILSAYIIPIKTAMIENKIEKRIDKVWLNFSEGSLKRHIFRGEVVVVDITAEWCLTCKYNKVAVLDNPFIIRFMRENKVIGLRGDYTKYNQEISDFLKSRKQYGIPYTVIFSKKYPEGIVLPTILKNSDFVNAIKKAR